MMYLRWTKRIFDFAIKRHVVETNPASAFDPSDAGGKEVSRDRWLSREEIIQLFQAMRDMLGRFSVENMYASDCCYCLPSEKKNSSPLLGRSLIWKRRLALA
jgi:hypothetical protein